MEQFLSLFITTIYAAESFFSPITGALPRTPASNIVAEKPVRSFGQLHASPMQVLGDSVDDTPPIVLPPTFITPTAKPKASKKPAPQAVPRRSGRSSVTIALLGDSMMDTMGPEAPALKDILKKTYPNTQITIKNYGVGGTNIDYGIERITSSYTYLGNAIPALSSINPDIVVVESFGYNPFSFDTGAIDKHWLALAKVVDTLRATVPNVRIVIGSTIAPNWDVFGDGAAGLSFGAQDKKQRVENIKKYLENAVRFAKSENLPLADAYHPSLDGSGNGKLAYINPGDHIHYSDAGRVFFAQKISNAIIANRLME